MVGQLDKILWRTAPTIQVLCRSGDTNQDNAHCQLNGFVLTASSKDQHHSTIYGLPIPTLEWLQWANILWRTAPKIQVLCRSGNATQIKSNPRPASRICINCFIKGPAPLHYDMVCPFQRWSGCNWPISCGERSSQGPYSSRAVLYMTGFLERWRYFGEHWKNGLWITM